MAKDPNNSDNENTPNQIGDFGLSRLAEIAAESRPSAEERELRRKAKVARKGIDVYEGLSDVARQYEPIQKLQKRNLNTLSRTEPRIRIAVESRQQRLTAQAVNTISREFSESSINASINELSLSPEAQAGATSMMSVPYNDLITQQRQRQTRLAELGQANRAMATKAIGRQGMNTQAYGQIQENTKEAQTIMGELGTITAALAQQKALGYDPKSRVAELFSKGAQAADIVNKAEIDKQITSGTGIGAKSNAELKQMEVDAAKKLVSALEDLKNATDDTKQGFQTLAEDAAKELGVVQTAIAGGAGGRGGRDTFMSYANIAQSGFGAAANAIQQIGVNQRLAQAQNATGYADFENQKYQAYKVAASGDVAALMQLSQFSGAEEFGGSIRTASQVAVGAQLAAGVTQTAMGAVDVATTFNPVENTLSTSAAQSRREGGIINTMEGAATTAVAGMDLYRGVSAGQAELAARQARMEVSRAVNAVGAEQVQGFRDFSVGLGTAAIGMGARGEEFLGRTLTDANLSRMSAARISPEQFAQLAQSGVASMGSMFDENQIFAARNFEQRGLGTTQENMQRMSALAAAGSNNPTASLGAITEQAVTRGLDSSKALNAVVDHTATMAASSAGRAIGLDTTAAAATLLTAGITKDTPNKEAALEQAASAQEVARAIGTNIGANYAGMVSVARTQRRLGVGGIQAVAAEGIDTETLMAINDEKDPKKKLRRLQELGVNLEGNRDVNKAVQTMVEDRQTKLLEAGGKGLVFNNRQALLKRVNSAQSVDELSGKDVTELADIARFSGMTGGAKDMFGVLKGVKAQVAKESFGPVNVDDKSLRTSLDKLRTAGFEQLSTAAATAATNLGGAAKAVSTLTTAIESLEKAMPNIERTSTTAAGRAAAGEGGMSVNVTKFNGAIDKLDRVLNNALTKSGLGGTSDNKQKAQPPGP